MTESREIQIDTASARRLLDRAEIIDVRTRYATGTDSHDWDLFRSCFTEQVEVTSATASGRPFGIFMTALSADTPWV